jgi:hypothetical protein
MGSLRKRLEKLEKASLEVRQRSSGSGAMPNYLNRFLEMVSGVEGAPYGPEDAEDARWMLREGMPAMRASKGWQSEGSQRLLSEGEEDKQNTLAAYYASEATTKKGDR